MSHILGLWTRHFGGFFPSLQAESENQHEGQTAGISLIRAIVSSPRWVQGPFLCMQWTKREDYLQDSFTDCPAVHKVQRWSVLTGSCTDSAAEDALYSGKPPSMRALFRCPNARSTAQGQRQIRMWVASRRPRPLFYCSHVGAISLGSALRPKRAINPKDSPDQTAEIGK